MKRVSRFELKRDGARDQFPSSSMLTLEEEEVRAGKMGNFGYIYIYIHTQICICITAIMRIKIFANG